MDGTTDGQLSAKQYTPTSLMEWIIIYWIDVLYNDESYRKIHLQQMYIHANSAKRNVYIQTFVIVAAKYILVKTVSM